MKIFIYPPPFQLYIHRTFPYTYNTQKQTKSYIFHFKL